MINNNPTKIRSRRGKTDKFALRIRYAGSTTQTNRRFDSCELDTTFQIYFRNHPREVAVANKVVSETETVNPLNGRKGERIFRILKSLFKRRPKIRA